MLTFEEKKQVIQQHFPELEAKEISLGRINYHFEESKRDKKIVVQNLHPNGNGFVYAGHLPKKERNEKGLINIRDYTEEALIDLIEASMNFLQGDDTFEEPSQQETIVEYWVAEDDERLLLIHEDELWNIYAGENLEAAFESYKEATEYLDEEGFKKE
ncbi:hypothetical protein A374_07504 [Fictibacillus macauensis ZFHKF-1]|uniref:Uncharacterized protein n=1 Tax=Fictibacillus macauensis ZFHKF-1 TaxID=1196324 RepID=I8AJH2_9BACL|nr:hypothetical protein [Fictibacillus macauensis]EIT85664.1 hypothetical protein A374_07504 [Fictibacillus macauensis ZFHKF-1]